MNSKQIMKVAVCATIIAICIVGAGMFPRQPATEQVSKPVSLRGAAAIDQLQKDGQLDSIQAAVNQARLSVRRAKNTPLKRDAWHAPNPIAGYDAYITESGVSVALDSESYVSLSLHTLGYGSDLRSVAPGEVSGDKQTINLERDGVQEWYVNGPDGLEQGFTLSEPPGVRQAGVPLRLALQVSEGWQAKAREDGQQVTLHNADGQTVEYKKLVVRDDLGHIIPARLTVAKEQVVIEVDDNEATYPLTIDPVFNVQQKLVEEDGEYSANFGRSVALDGDTLVVGQMHREVGTNENQGEVYVFTRSNGVWTEQQRITASDGASNDFFGETVAISGDTLVASAPDNTETVSDQGAVYVFTRSNGVWTEQQKLTASDAGEFDRFGEAVALDLDTVVVGVRYDDAGTDLNENRGSAYVFTRSSGIWTQQQKITAFDGASSDMFGQSVTVDGDTLAVGVPLDNIGSEFDRGSTYVYKRNGTVWSLQQKITAGDGETQDNFGSSVSLDGDNLGVGAETDIGVQAQGGSVYIFKRNGTVWTQQQKVRGSDTGPTDRLGFRIALEGDTLVAGARFHDTDGNNNQGAAYIFKRNGTVWSEQQKLTASDGAARDLFGLTVAMSGDTIVVGAPDDDIDEINDQGSVYIFHLSQCPISIVPAGLPNGFINFSYEKQMTVSGGTGPYQFALAGGTLPPGLSLSPSGLLSGTTTTLGTYQFTISVTDLGGACSSSLTYTVKVRSCPDLLIQSELTPGNLNTFYNEPLFVTTGMPPYTFVALSGVPPGLSLSPDGLLSGTPTELGQFTLSVLITDANGCTDEGETLVTILPEPIDCSTLTLTPDTLSNGFSGVPFHQQLTVNGTPEPFQFALFDGELPPGISLSSSGLLSGTPTTAGTYQFMILANDLNNFCFLSAAYTITIGLCPTLTVNPTTLSAGMVGEPYSEMFNVTGGVAPFTFVAQAGLPPGLTLNSNGLLSGTPTVDGFFNIRFVVTDVNGCYSKRDIPIVILTTGPGLPETSKIKRGNK